jgi:calcium-dependent protein kinase
MKRLQDGEFLSEKIGTPYYIAPEVLGRKYGFKCDIWSCGVIAYICLFGRAPFEGKNDQEILHKVRKARFSLDEPLGLNITISDEAKQFLQYLINPVEEKRPSALEALSHPWLKLAH